MKLTNHLVESLNHNSGFYFKISKTIKKIQTKYQLLEILEIKDYGRVLRLDRIFQTSYRDEFLYHEPMVHVAAITINGPKTALVIGGGDGGSIEEILKYSSVKKIVMVELDEMVVEMSKKYLPQISNGAFESDKLELRFEDGLQYIKKCIQQNQKFDQIVLDLTDAFGPSASLYTQEFYQSINNILNKNGALSLHIESPIARPEVFSKLYHTLKSVFHNVIPMLNYIPMYGTLWGFAICSQNLDVKSMTSKTIKKRIKKFSLKNMQYYNENTHFSLLNLPNFIQDLLKESQSPYKANDIILEEELLNEKLYIGKE